MPIGLALFRSFTMVNDARSASVVANLLDVQAVAEVLDCSPRTVYRLSDAGKMPAPVIQKGVCSNFAGYSDGNVCKKLLRSNFSARSYWGKSPLCRLPKKNEVRCQKPEGRIRTVFPDLWFQFRRVTWFPIRNKSKNDHR